MKLWPRREPPAVPLHPIELRPIGVVRSRVTHPARMPVAGERATVQVRAGLEPALAGLEGFSHAIVITWLDRVSDEERVLARERPGGDPTLAEVGVLALRTHHRPNPIGVSVVAIEGRDGAALRVRGLDAVDGTPVLDLKPYVPTYDSVPDARLPRWAGGDD